MTINKRLKVENYQVTNIESEMKKSMHNILRLKTIAAIPCFNTERSIAEVIKKTREYVDEVIVINDGSWDKTAEIASAAGAKVINHNNNLGYGAAIKSCLAAFQNSNADVLVTIDGDGQHNPAEIPSLIELVLDKQADLVIGSRFINNQLKMPHYRKFGIGVITFLWNSGSKIKITDSQSGFRVYSKKVVTDLRLKENGMSISIEILEKIRKKHSKICEVPITCSYGLDNSRLNINAIKHGMRVSLSVIRIRMENLF